MLYIICPTCGYFLGQKIIEWENKSIEICTNPNLTDIEKEEQKQQLLLSLNLPRYCCRMRMISYKDIIYDIIPL